MAVVKPVRIVSLTCSLIGDLYIFGQAKQGLWDGIAAVCNKAVHEYAGAMDS